MAEMKCKREIRSQKENVKRTKVVNIRQENYEVYIGRSGRGMDGYFGNPFKLLPGMVRGETLDRFREYFYKRLQTDPEFKKRIDALQGKTLGCFCKPYPCHEDIIKEYLDSQLTTTEQSKKHYL